MKSKPKELNHQTKAEVSKEYQHISLHIYDTPIHINVPADQEALYREASTLINDRLNAYNNAYKGKKSDKEIGYYALIDVALRCTKESKRNDVEPLKDILKKLTAEVEEVL